MLFYKHERVLSVIGYFITKLKISKFYRFFIKRHGTKKIFIVCPGPEGSAPGQPLKYEQCFEHWQENDYNITIKPFISESF